MRVLKLAFITAVLVSLSACNVLPVYQPAANEKMVPVKLMAPGKYSFCRSGTRYQLPIEQPTPESNVVQVPAGERIGLAAYISQSGYHKITYCTTGLSFNPLPDQTYIVNRGVYQGKCFIEVVKQDDDKDTGVSLEPSVSKYNDGCSIPIVQP